MHVCMHVSLSHLGIMSCKKKRWWCRLVRQEQSLIYFVLQICVSLVPGILSLDCHCHCHCHWPRSSSQNHIASAKIRNSNFTSHFKPRSSWYHPSQLQKIPSQQQQRQQQRGNSSSSSSSTITNAIPNLHHKSNHLFQNLLNPSFVNSPPINHSFHACVHNIGMKELKENSYKKCQER